MQTILITTTFHKSSLQVFRHVLVVLVLHLLLMPTSSCPISTGILLGYFIILSILTCSKPSIYDLSTKKLESHLIVWVMILLDKQITSEIRNKCLLKKILVLCDSLRPLINLKETSSWLHTLRLITATLLAGAELLFSMVHVMDLRQGRLPYTSVKDNSTWKFQGNSYSNVWHVKYASRFIADLKIKTIKLMHNYSLRNLVSSCK